MANHSYVELKTPITVAEAEALLRQIVERRLKSAQVVRDPQAETVEKQKAAWRVEAGAAFFPVWLNKNGRVLEFRHSPNLWASWGQQIVKHEAAKNLRGILTSDESDKPLKINPEQFKSSFWQFLLSMWDEEDARQELVKAPPGFNEEV